MLRIALVLVLFLPASAAAQGPPLVGGCEQTPICSVVAGTGEAATEDTRGDGGPATEATFREVDGVDWAGDGSILVADGSDGRIRRITPSGNIVTNSSEEVTDPVAVISTGWYPNDAFHRHSFVASDAIDNAVESWSLNISQLGAYTWSESRPMEELDATDVEAALSGIWVVDPFSETVYLVEFFGSPAPSWHASPALEGLHEPRGVGPLPGGGFLVATHADCRIWRHTSNGTALLAGTGFCAGEERSGDGDGGPALNSHLRFPLDVEATPDGGFVFIERDRVRHVTAGGTITTVYVTGFNAPEQPAPEPHALEMTPDGDVLIGIDRQILRLDTNYADAATPTPTPTATPNPLPVPPTGPVVTTAKLTASLSKSAYKVAKGKKLAFKFTAGAPGGYAIAIRKGKKVKKTFKGKAKAGANTVKKKIRLKPGKYGVRLTVKAGGETVTDTAKLKVSKRR